MNSISINEYKSYMGTLIDIRPKYEASINKYKNAVNIPYNELIFNHQKYLNKNQRYFIICSKGVQSKKAVNILSVYGYEVYNVIH